jgi:hypothetical protein
MVATMSEPSDTTGAPPSADELQSEIDRLAARNEQLQSKLQVRSRLRSVLTGMLLVVTALLLVASTVAVWGNRTVFDTDRFMGVVDPALDDPAFYESLSRNISEQALAALDLETRVSARLTQLDEFLAQQLVDALDVRDSVRTALSLVDRPTLADLTPAIVDPLEERVENGITTFITSERFQQRLPELVRRSHEATIALIDGDGSDFPNVYIAEGEVRINLIPIIVEALEPVIDTLAGFLPDVTLPRFVSERVSEARVQLGEALGVRLPDDFGQLTVMTEDSLAGIQDTARRIDRAVWALVIVTGIVLALTLLTAKDKRRTVIWLAVAITAALGASWWIIARIRQAVLDRIPAPDSRAAIRALLQETTDSFRTYVLVVLAIAAVAGLYAFVVAHLDELADARRWARRQTGDEPTALNEWVTKHYDGLRAVGFVVAAVALLVIGIDLVPFLVLGSLLGLYLLALGAVRRDAPSTEAAVPEH